MALAPGDALVEATDVAARCAAAIEADGVGRFDERPLEVAIDVWAGRPEAGLPATGGDRGGGGRGVGAVSKGGLVEVSVSDTGVGIAPEDQEAVFQEFRQVGTAEKKAEGTGLGLTLCRKFIELH